MAASKSKLANAAKLPTADSQPFFRPCLIFTCRTHYRWNLVFTNKFVPCRPVTDADVMELAVAGDALVLVCATCELNVPLTSGSLNSVTVYLANTFDPSASVKVL